MSDQRQHENMPDALLRPAGGNDNAQANRLIMAREELDRLNAATAEILDKIRQGDSTLFLDQIQQSGGE